MKASTITLCVLLFLPIVAMTLAGEYPKDALHKAAYAGDVESVKRILAANPDVHARDSFGGTALHAAMFQKNTEIVTLLIAAGCDVNAQGVSNDYTPLHDAVWADNVEAAIILLKNQADRSIKGKDGLTPLEKAEKEGKRKMAETLKATG